VHRRKIWGGKKGGKKPDYNQLGCEGRRRPSKGKKGEGAARRQRSATGELLVRKKENLLVRSGSLDEGKGKGQAKRGQLTEHSIYSSTAAVRAIFIWHPKHPSKT